MDQGRSGQKSPGVPSLLVGGGHLAALWALAFVAPLFDLLGNNAEFFVARGNDAGDILVFSLVFALAPPLAMLAIEALAELIDTRLRWGIHLLLVALLAAAIALQIAKKLADGPGGLLIVIALIVGAATAAAYARTRFLRSVADVLIPAPVVLLAFFLLFSDVSELVLPQDEAKATAIDIPSRAPVVEIIFDEFPVGSLMDRGGGIDASRFPAFAELARHSTWYRGATTVSGFTPRAVPAILTGTSPSADELPTSTDEPRSVFTLLGGSYRMHVMEEATALCPESLCGDEARPTATSGLGSLFSDLRVVSEHLLLPNGIREHLPAVDQTFGDFAEKTDTRQPATTVARRRFAPGDADAFALALRRRVTDDESIRLAHFLSGLRDREATLNLIHVMKPHAPWTHFPDGRKYTNLSAEFDPVLAEDSTWLGPESLTDLALQRVLLETGFTDHLLGAVIARMKRTGLWDRAVFIVVADHGNAVIPHQPRRNPTRQNLGQIAPVPLFIKAPGQTRGRVVDRHVCTTDVLPTTARLLHIRYPWRRTPCPLGEVKVADSAEGATRLGFGRVERLRDAYVARIERLFGDGTGWRRVLRFRPHPELVGRSASGLATTPAGAESASLEDANRLRDVNPRAPVVLASLLRGSISGARPGEALAAAVNGRIGAVGTSFADPTGVHFSLLVPPHFLRRGVNRVELYRVLGSGSALRLQSLGPAR
jgi:Sulfatase